MKVNVNILVDNLDTADRRKKAIEAAHCLELIINSTQFADMIISMPDDWRLGETSFFKDLTNFEILEYIISGKEEWHNEVDNEIDMIIEDYHRWGSRVVGYMIPFKPTTWVNTKFFDQNHVKLVTSNFLHEYFHHLGMRHGGEFFRWSIPYYANKIVEDIFYEVCTVEPPQYKEVCFRSWRTLWRKRCKLVKVNS
jgi:hypothetical protein